MSQSAIETHKLTKIFGNGGESVAALRDLDLAIAQGEIYALLGPNGAGKTTAISILTTLLSPTSGTAIVAGFDVCDQAEQVRRRIGVTFQETVLDQELTGRQTLDFHGQLYGQTKSVRLQRLSELADMVELSEALDRRVSHYSGGMKRRLELARGLMTSPDILFLDEPTQGLDPQNRSRIWDYLRRLRNETGVTLLLTTHYMEEADALADRVGFIDNGSLVIEGRPQDLVRELGADVVTILGYGDIDGLSGILEALSYVSHLVLHHDDNGWRLQIGVDHGDKRLIDLLGHAQKHDIAISEVSVSRPTLADVFLAHTGHALRDR